MNRSPSQRSAFRLHGLGPCFGCVLVLVQISAACQAQQVPPANPLVFTSITVIDGTGKGPTPNQTVVIDNNRIQQIGPPNQVRIPTNARIVKAAGKFMIPGLWDAHVHLDSLLGSTPAVSERLAKRVFLPLLVANGITGVRDMGSLGGFEPVRTLRRDISLGVSVGPRIIAPGPAFDGPVQHRGPHAVTNATEGRKAVIAMKQGGADFVKVMSLVPRDAFFGITDEAKKQGLTVVGHVPESVSATEASDAGQRSMEHLLGIWQDSSTMSAESKKALVQEIYDPKSPSYVRKRIAFDLPPRGVLETFSEQDAAVLFRRLAKNQTWQVPTLVEDQSFALRVEGRVLDQAGMKYVPVSMRKVWDLPNVLKGFDHQDLDDLRNVVMMKLKVVGAMHRSGVRIMAGSDAPFLVVPGFALHDELALLVKAGLTPMEALQTATRNTTEFAGMSSTLGTVEQGKVADLVVLDADPLQDITNTRRINAVVVNGRLYNRRVLDQMLRKVAAEVSADRE